MGTIVGTNGPASCMCKPASCNWALRSPAVVSCPIGCESGRCLPESLGCPARAQGPQALALSAGLCSSGGSVVDLADCAVDHLSTGTSSPSGLVVMSQQVSTLESTYGAGSNSRPRMPASPRSPASTMA